MILPRFSDVVSASAGLIADSWTHRLVPSSLGEQLHDMAPVLKMAAFEDGSRNEADKGPIHGTALQNHSPHCTKTM